MKKLIYILFVLITIAFAVAAIAGFATGRMNPEGKEWISFPGLVLLPVRLLVRGANGMLNGVTGIGGQSMSFLDVVCL